MNKITSILGSNAKPHRSHRPSLVFAYVLMGCLLLGGCGQKGPLYLPAPAKSPSTPSESK